MIDIRTEKLSILELLKEGKTGCIYPGTDLFYKTNVVRDAPFIGNGEPPFVSYRTETFYFNRKLEISSVVVSFDIDKPYNSLFKDYEYFKNLPIDEFFALTESFGFIFSSILKYQDKYENFETLILDRVQTKAVYLANLNVDANYLTNRLNSIGITFTYDNL